MKCGRLQKSYKHIPCRAEITGKERGGAKNLRNETLFCNFCRHHTSARGSWAKKRRRVDELERLCSSELRAQALGQYYPRELP